MVKVLDGLDQRMNIFETKGEIVFVRVHGRRHPRISAKKKYIKDCK